jgi:hypothetical protein
MAQFIGTVQEFHHYVGPRIRNVVNTAAAPHRKALGGVCEECGQKAELQSAHVHGHERRALIEGVLLRYARADGRVDCDLKSVEREIIDAHMPIEKTFRFLCQPCHVAYDAGTRQRVARPGRLGVETDGEFSKLHRVKSWAERPHQDNHRIIRAFLALEASGDVTRDSLREYCTTRLGMEKFDAKFPQLKTDAGNSYGKVFYEENGVVRMWPVVREEVDCWF